MTRVRPLFLVGQVVAMLDGESVVAFANITRRYWDANGPKFKGLDCWAYDLQHEDGKAWPERLLRSLTLRERGEKP